jgi:hypothetical protein
MPYSIQMLLLIASLSPLKNDKKSSASNSGDEDVRQVIEPIVAKIGQTVAEFLQQRVTRRKPVSSSSSFAKKRGNSPVK